MLEKIARERIGACFHCFVKSFEVTSNRLQHRLRGDLWHMFTFRCAAFHALYLCDQTCGRFTWKFEPRTSGITYLTLKDSAVTASSLSGFLKGIKDLRRFWYEATAEDFEFVHWYPRGIIASLIEIAKDSLKELDLAHSDNFYSTWAVAYRMPMGSLRGFDTLKHIKVEVAMLFDKIPKGERKQGSGFVDE